MGKNRLQKENDLFSQLKWVIISRVGFAVVLIISCLVFSSGENLSFFSQPFLALYNIAALILFLSIFYLICLNRFKKIVALAYIQTIIDTCLVTGIILVTGSYDSMFTFLYLVVIIYTSMLLFQKGSLIVAAISSVQYGLLMELEYYRVITPYLDQFYFTNAIDSTHVIYRIIIMIAACFGVAILSGILALQLKGARQDLKLAQEHLKRVERMEVMDELISGIAHEVKNPLASLSGSIQLLKEDTRPGSYEDKLMQIILRETDRLKTIVNDIHLFSKPNTKNARIINMAESIEETVQLFLNDPEWNQKISISMRMDPEVHVKMDPAHLNQIMWNLLKNAAQSIEDSGEIKIRVITLKPQRVYLTVEDTGSGIKIEAFNHIFDPFYTTKPEGTGLGLPIIHRIVDTYSGMIDFESVPGKGTKFTIFLNGISPEQIKQKVS